MGRFEFATATRIVFGAGAIADAGNLTSELGRRVLVVTGQQVERAEPLIDRLRRQDVLFTTFAVDREPDIDLIERGVSQARASRCDAIVGIGGGSAIDAAKAIAVLTTNSGEVLDYLEVIGKGRPLSVSGLPCIAVPTTAGTGSEVTRNAVVASPQHRVKVSLRSPVMFPRIALVDPELTLNLPTSITATTGLDALTQLIEAYVSSRANPMTDALCREGIRRAAGGIRRAWADGHDAAAREDMALAALWSGIALTNAGLGAVHGFAGPIGGMFDAPHGAICAALLPHVMAANLRALQSRAPAHPAIARFEQVARLFTLDESATAESSVVWVERLVHDLRISSLRQYGVQPSDIPAVVARAEQASSMKANPVQLTTVELSAVLQQAI